MALVVANAVSSSHTVESAASGTARAARSRDDFLTSLQAVLDLSGAANDGTAVSDEVVSSAIANASSLTKLKSKLQSDTASNTLAADLLAAQQQTASQQSSAQPATAAQTATAQATAAAQASIVNALESTQIGVAIPALRLAIGKNNTSTGFDQALPVANPVKNVAATPATSSTPRAEGTISQYAAADSSTAEAVSAASRIKGANVSDPTVTQTTQAKLAAALAQAAQAPILKDGTADGSRVPNAKIGRNPRTQIQDGATAAGQLAQTATRIAAAAGATSTPDSLPAAAQAVAVAEGTAKTAPSAAASITKLEVAAMSNSAQAALHVATPQETTDAQALPIQFDALSNKSDYKKLDVQPDLNGKNQDASGGSRMMNNAPSLAQTTVDSQQQQPGQQAASPVQPPTTEGAATANLAAPENSVTAVQTPARFAANIHVTPQTQQLAPDQATFAALGVAIATKSRDGEHQFDIKMDPAELGKVDVRISVDASGTAQAHLSIQHQQTLELLQNDKATLERNLRDAGLNLANNGLNFSLKGEQQSSTPTFNARNRALSVSAVQGADPTSATTSTSIAPGDSRLDIRV